MIKLRTASKINLGLQVTGRRPDGYHTLNTRFQTIDLGDLLELSPADEVRLCVDPPGAAPADSSNLVWRAAERLRPLADGAGVSIRLQKEVPAGAGLGGGSGDAAATLLGLDRLWSLGLGPGGLESHAAALGADVPFFLHGGTARATGRGDVIVTEEDSPREEILLLQPEGMLSTAEVFATLDSLTKVKGASTIRLAGHPAPRCSDENHLERAVIHLRPDIRDLLAELERRGASARVSGSGVCVFGRFRDRLCPAGAELDWPAGVVARRLRFLSREEYWQRLSGI